MEFRQLLAVIVNDPATEYSIPDVVESIQSYHEGVQIGTYFCFSSQKSLNHRTKGIIINKKLGTLYLGEIMNGLEHSGGVTYMIQSPEIIMRGSYKEGSLEEGVL